MIRQTDRQTDIDLVEVIGILFVLIYHGSLYKSDFLIDDSAVVYLRYWFTALLSTCVPLFFFANGYLLLNRDFSLKKHLKKILKIYFLVGIWGVMGQVLQMPAKGEHLTIINLIHGVCDLRQGWINHLWYLGALSCIYTFFPFIKYMYDHSRILFLYFLVMNAAFTFGDVLLSEAAEIVPTLIFKRHRILPGFNFFRLFNPFRENYGYAFTYFCLGGLMYEWKDAIKNIKPYKRNILSVFVLLLSMTGLMALGIFYSNIQEKRWDVVWNGYDTVFTLINIVCIYILCLNYKRDFKIIRCISTNTLGVYLIHGIINAYAKPIIYDVVPNSILITIIYAACLLSLCTAISLLMKKIPVIRKLVTLTW